MSTEKKVSVWAIDQSRHTPEELEKIQLRAESTDRADKFFKDLYGQSVSWVIVANIMEQGSRAGAGRFHTFEEAWDILPFEQITEIIFRAVNGLPCAEKDTGQMAEFKKRSLKRKNESSRDF